MPLDSNLFVLLVRPRQNQPGFVDFVVDRTAEGGTAEEVAYTAYKDPQTSTLTLLDPLSSLPLGTHSLSPPTVPNSAPSPRVRLIHLDSPSVDVFLRNKSGISWAWEMDWEGARYVWEREVGNPFSAERGFTLLASRKPDPNYPVASYSPRKKGGSIEVYDHNLSRVEPPIQDKKGLEITLLLALSFFLDPLFGLPSPSAPLPASSSSSSSSPSAASPAPTRKVPPPIPPVPPPQRQDRGKKLDVNEVEVLDASPAAVEGYCGRCLSLLEDPTLLYLLIFASSSPQLIPAVAALAERVKRERYKRSGEELLVFVDDDAAEDGGGGGKGGRESLPSPPTSLRIYLSRIELSELLPNHRKKPSLASPGKPPIRSPIDFDAGEGGARGKGKDEGKEGGESGGGGGWRALFGAGGGGGSR